MTRRNASDSTLRDLERRFAADPGDLRLLAEIDFQRARKGKPFFVLDVPSPADVSEEIFKRRAELKFQMTHGLDIDLESDAERMAMSEVEVNGAGFGGFTASGNTRRFSRWTLDDQEVNVDAFWEVFQDLVTLAGRSEFLEPGESVKDGEPGFDLAVEQVGLGEREISAERGWWGRWTMPGYLDSGMWHGPFETATEAEAAANENIFGDEDEAETNLVAEVVHDTFYIADDEDPIPQEHTGRVRLMERGVKPGARELVKRIMKDLGFREVTA